MLSKHTHRPNSVFGAVALMVGTAVGAGIFGLPYVFVRSGVGLGLIYVVGLGAMITLVHLAYGEVVLATTGTHQFPNYVEKYLGRGWKYVALASTFIGLYGALAAYLLESSKLLDLILRPAIDGTKFWFIGGYAAVLSIALYIGLRAISNLEKVLVVVMLSLVGLLVVVGWPHVQLPNFSTSQPADLFLPYGVVLFAISALSSVPDMKNILQGKLSQLKRAIIIGSIVPLAVYIVFTLMVVGITGPATTESAVAGLGHALGQPVLIFGSVFGIITMSTSFLMIGLVLKEVYMYDWHWPAALAWLGVMLPPMLLVLLGWLSFIEILGISGALIGGLDGIMIMKMHRRLHANQDRRSEFSLTQSRWVHGLAYVVFICGIGYEIYIVAQRLF